MTGQAKAFLERWEFENIKVVASSEQADEARRLASQCREDATKAGISDRDLEAAAAGDLVDSMVSALSAALFRQLAAEQWADEE
jgi:vacuolar-type H+-ATPase subunit C/Vma6